MPAASPGFPFCWSAAVEAVVAVTMSEVEAAGEVVAFGFRTFRSVGTSLLPLGPEAVVEQRAKTMALQATPPPSLAAPLARSRPMAAVRVSLATELGAAAPAAEDAPRRGVEVRD